MKLKIIGVLLLLSVLLIAPAARAMPADSGFTSGVIDELAVRTLIADNVELEAETAGTLAADDDLGRPLAISLNNIEIESDASPTSYGLFFLTLLFMSWLIWQRLQERPDKIAYAEGI